MFSTLSRRENIILATFNLSSADAFSLVKSRILLFGEQLIEQFLLFHSFSSQLEYFTQFSSNLDLSSGNFVSFENLSFGKGLPMTQIVKPVFDMIENIVRKGESYDKEFYQIQRFADDKLNVAKMTFFLCDRVENTGKRRKCW